jgi:nucleotide-binding universal stress UspA family protein
MTDQKSAVVVGYDDSPAAGRALDRAIVEAREADAKLVVVAVEELPLDPTGLQNFGSLDYSPPDATALGPPSEIQDVLGRARTVIESAGFDAEYVWAAGSAASTIVDAARDNRAELIVLGEHHHSFLGRVFGNDVGAEVERRAGARVISVP